MKRYIKNSKSLIADLPTLETISVSIDADITKYIESVDLIDEGLLEDTQVIAEWQDFLISVEGFIERHTQLELLYDEPGNPLEKFPGVEGSHYYYIGVKNSEGKYIGKVVVDFRLSTHQSTKQSAKERIKHEGDALKIIQKKYPSATGVEPKGLIVNKKEFKDYDATRFAVHGMLENIVKDFCY